MSHQKIIDSRNGYRRTYEYRITAEDSRPKMLTLEPDTGGMHSITYAHLNRLEFEGGTIRAFFLEEIIELAE